jgi:hypothetical protein
MCMAASACGTGAGEAPSSTVPQAGDEGAGDARRYMFVWPPRISSLKVGLMNARASAR